MARERFVTRTIDTWEVDVLCAYMHQNGPPPLKLFPQLYRATSKRKILQSGFPVNGQTTFTFM